MALTIIERQCLATQVDPTEDATEEAKCVVRKVIRCCIKSKTVIPVPATSMSLITNRQQELIDISIKESLLVLDKTSAEYLSVRQAILQLSSEIQGEPSDAQSIKAKTYELELDMIWEAYKIRLREINTQLDIISNVKSENLQRLNNEYETMLSQKITLNKRLKNIKEIQLPLLQQMNKLQSQLVHGLSKVKCRRFATKNTVKNNEDLDLLAIMYSKQQLVDLMISFDAKVDGLTTIYDLDDKSSKSIKATAFITDELQEDTKFLALDNDRYLFRLSRLTQQDAFMANASIEDYDEMIDNLTNEIVESINFGTASKQNWINNAAKFDKFKSILETQN